MQKNALFATDMHTISYPKLKYHENTKTHLHYLFGHFTWLYS